jgi:hypothetical protein
MTAMTGAERSRKLRDKEKADGTQRLVMKLTATERGWIQQGMDIGGFECHTEFLLAAAKFYNENRAET